MKNFIHPYYTFYASFVIMLFTAVFLDKHVLLYVKPLVLISLSWMYVANVSKVDYWYLVSMLLVMMLNDTLVYIDFMKYFKIVSVTIAVYYAINLYLLRAYITIEDFRIKNVISLPIITSIILIVYLMTEIIRLVLPVLMGFFSFFLVVIVSMTIFVGVCFYIYINDKYIAGLKLFIASYCCLFVNALLPINEFYYYTRLFTVLINVVEVIGFYFFLRFLIDVESDLEYLKKEEYL